MVDAEGARGRGARAGDGGGGTSCRSRRLTFRRRFADATEHQPAARAALAAALAAPAHAYLFAGPPASGKRAAARAFAAELLGRRRARSRRRAPARALADPSPHPDLVWLAPPGTQHLVDEVRERVIVAAAYRPFEGERRVFVIEAAEAMADESQNALLEDARGAAAVRPPGPDHLRARGAAGDGALALPGGALRAARRRRPSSCGSSELGLGGGDEERRAAARLAGGDTDRAAFLLAEQGRELRAAAEACVGGGALGRARRCPLAWPARARRRRRASRRPRRRERGSTALAAEAGEGESRGGSAPLARGGGGRQARRAPRPDRGARPRAGPGRRLAARPGGGRRGRRGPGPELPTASRSSELRRRTPTASTRAARARAPSW